VRNVLRFFLGNLSGFKPEDMPPVDDWPALERYVAYEWGNAIHTIRQHFANCSFHLGLQVCNEKLVHLFSSFYFDIRKDVLYAESATSLVRRSAQACLYVCLHSFIRLLAPVLAFTTEEAWGYLGKLLGHEESSVHVQPYPLSPSDSVFLPIWSILKARKEVCDLEQAFAWVYQLRRESHKALEEARTQGHIRSSLEACLRLQLPYAWQDILQRLGFDKKMFADLLIVSQVEFSFVHEALSVAVNLAQGSKCARCWLYFVNDTAQHSTPEAICGRCQGVLACS
jgi:isoleucyl-tRNA synthetase